MLKMYITWHTVQTYVYFSTTQIEGETGVLFNTTHSKLETLISQADSNCVQFGNSETEMAS